MKKEYSELVWLGVNGMMMLGIAGTLIGLRLNWEGTRIFSWMMVIGFFLLWGKYFWITGKREMISVKITPIRTLTSIEISQIEGELKPYKHAGKIAIWGFGLSIWLAFWLYRLLAGDLIYRLGWTEGKGNLVIWGMLVALVICLLIGIIGTYSKDRQLALKKDLKEGVKRIEGMGYISQMQVGRSGPVVSFRIGSYVFPVTKELLDAGVPLNGDLKRVAVDFSPGTKKVWKVRAWDEMAAR